MRCSKCGAENPEGKKFCGDCGAALENRCPQCGAQNPSGKRFCGDCGAELAGGGLSQQLSSPRPPASGVPLPTTQAEAPPSGDGKRRHLTVLFSDLVGSTEIAGHLDPEDWRDIAAEYQRTATAAVIRFGGHVAKYLGDGVMAYFGWPQAHEDDAERAVRAGLAIVEDVDGLNGRLAATHNVKLSVRVGIQTGSVVMSHSGGEQADVFGDAPNVASRVQSAAEPNSVLITAAVHELVSGLFVVEDHGARQLKGVEHPVRLYRAIQPTAARRRTAARALTPFVGRDDEMHVLLSRWERAREGRGQLALVMGEPGIGKSRLLEEFRTRIKDDLHIWVECAGEQLFQSTPFHAVTQILDQGLGWRGDESPQDRVSQLEGRLERVGLKLGEAVPLIAEMLRLPTPEKYPALTFEPEQKRKRLLANLAGWVLNGSHLQPTVIAMEDLHWVDPSTLELTQILVEQAATAPLMLLCTARPEFRVPWPMRAHHAQITLNRLNEGHTREMVAAVVARAALAQEMIDTVVQRTDGVPLFAEELTRLLLEGESRSVAREIPATLHDSLAARLDRLGPAKEVAQIAAVIGREFTYELLEAVSARPVNDLQAALEKLVDAELIYARGIVPEASYQFKHALIQDAAYEELLKTRRRELHRRVAQTISDSFAAVAEAQPEVIARHWTEAGETEPAIAAWRKVADNAYGRNAFKEAEEGYRQTLALLGTLPDSRERDSRELQLINRFARVLQVTRGWASPEAANAAARAEALAAKSGDLAQLVLQMAGSFASVVNSGDMAAASAIAGRMLDCARREGSSAILGLAYCCAVNVSYFRGDLESAEKHFSAGANMFEPAAKKFPAGSSALGWASHAAWMLGHSNAARVRIGQAITAATAAQNPFELAYAQFLRATLHIFLREFEVAKSAAAASVKLSDEYGFKQHGARSRISLGVAEAVLGRPDVGIPIVELGLDGLNDSGKVVGQPLYLSWVATARALDGKVPQALETIEEALQASPAELAWRPEAIRTRGELRVRLNDPQAGEADFREAVAQSRNMSAKMLELRAIVNLARLLRDTNRGDEARAMLSDIYNWFTGGFDTADLKDAKALLDELSGSP